MKNQEKSDVNVLKEEDLDVARARRKELMEEVDRHLKGGRQISEEDLAKDPYINYALNP